MRTNEFIYRKGHGPSIYDTFSKAIEDRPWTEWSRRQRLRTSEQRQRTCVPCSGVSMIVTVGNLNFFAILAY